MLCKRKGERERQNNRGIERMRQTNQAHRGRDTEKVRNTERTVFRVELSRNNEELILKLNTSVYRPQM